VMTNDLPNNGMTPRGRSVTQRLGESNVKFCEATAASRRSTEKNEAGSIRKAARCLFNAARYETGFLKEKAISPCTFPLNPGPSVMDDPVAAPDPDFRTVFDGLRVEPFVLQ